MMPKFQSNFQTLLVVSAIAVTTAGPGFCDTTTSAGAPVPAAFSLPLSLLWKTTARDVDQTPETPTYANGVVYFAAGKSVLAEKADNGAAVWAYHADAAFNASPVLSGDGLYAGSDDGAFCKLSLKDGSVVWKQQVSSALRSAPSVANGRVYFGSNDGNIYALNCASGAIVWTHPAGTAISTPLAVTDRGDVIFVAGDDTLTELNGDTGQQQWQVAFRDSPTDSPPVFVNGMVYVGAGRNLYAVNPRHGETIWKLQLAADISAPCTVDGRRLYVCTDDNKITALNDRGVESWSAGLPSHSATQATLAGSTIFVGTEHGVLTAYSADNGAMQWQYVVQSSKNVKGCTIAASNTLFTLGSDGSLSAFQSKAPDQDSPVITLAVPQPNGNFTGTDIPFTAAVVDEGSGIAPKSISLTVDGKLQASVAYNPALNGFVKPAAPPAGPLTPAVYADGPHTISITAADWRGNTTTQTWTFNVDNSEPARNAKALALINSGQDPNYPYPMPPSTDPATRFQQRKQALAIWQQLMQDHLKNGGPMPPTPPSY